MRNLNLFLGVLLVASGVLSLPYLTNTNANAQINSSSSSGSISTSSSGSTSTSSSGATSTSLSDNFTGIWKAFVNKPASTSSSSGFISSSGSIHTRHGESGGRGSSNVTLKLCVNNGQISGVIQRGGILNNGNITSQTLISPNEVTVGVTDKDDKTDTINLKLVADKQLLITFGNSETANGRKLNPLGCTPIGNGHGGHGSDNGNDGNPSGSPSQDNNHGNHGGSMGGQGMGGRPDNSPFPEDTPTGSPSPDDNHDNHGGSMGGQGMGGRPDNSSPKPTPSTSPST